MFKKSTIKDVLSLALPAVGEMILYMMIWVFDTLMVGQYGGKLTVSAVGLSSEILYTFANIFISVGIAIGITSLVARKYGAKEYDLAEEYATLGFTVGIIVSIVIVAVLFVFSRKFLIWAGCEANVINLGVTYMRIACIGLFFNMLMSLMNAILRGYGNTMTPLLASIVINLINIPLDYALIFGRFGFPSLGVKGAALATTIAQTTGFICVLLYTLKKSKIKLKLKYITSLRFDKLKTLIKLSIPASLQEAAFSSSRLLTTFMVMYLGTVAFAANQITTTIESISFMPGWGFAVAATTLAGHKIGEKNFKAAKEYAYTCMFLGTAVMCFCGVIFLLCPKFLISLFINSSETEVIRQGTYCLMIAALEQPSMAISMILGGSLKGAGDTKTPFIVSMLTGWLIRVPLVYYFLYLNKYSIVYFWWIIVIQWTVDAILIFILFKKKFKKISFGVDLSKDINSLE